MTPIRLSAIYAAGGARLTSHAVRGVRGALVVVAGAAERGGARGHARVVGEHEVAEEVLRLPPAQRGRVHELGDAWLGIGPGLGSRLRLRLGVS